MKELLVTIMTHGFTFLVGIGVGAGITDMIWRMKEGDKDNGKREKMDDE